MTDKQYPQKALEFASQIVSMLMKKPVSEIKPVEPGMKNAKALALDYCHTTGLVNERIVRYFIEKVLEIHTNNFTDGVLGKENVLRELNELTKTVGRRKNQIDTVEWYIRDDEAVLQNLNLRKRSERLQPEDMSQEQAAGKLGVTQGMVGKLISQIREYRSAELRAAGVTREEAQESLEGFFYEYKEMRKPAKTKITVEGLEAIRLENIERAERPLRGERADREPPKTQVLTERDKFSFNYILLSATGGLGRQAGVA